MHDLRFDRNSRMMDEHDNRVQWAFVAILLLLCGGLILAASMTGTDTQTAMNSPSIERVTPIPTIPPQNQ